MKIDLLEKNLNRSHEWIRAADQKASIWLAFQGVCLTIILSTVARKDILNYIIVNFSCFDIIIFLFVIILYLFSISKTIFSIIPKVIVRTGGVSMIYFGTIANLKIDEYKKKMKNYDNSDYETDLLDQIYISSSIAEKKHNLFFDSIYSFIFSTAIFLLFLFIKFIYFIYGN